MDTFKSDTVGLELKTYTKQKICSSRMSELILKNMCTISMHNLFSLVVAVALE